jgi:hypothetical protein
MFASHLLQTVSLHGIILRAVLSIRIAFFVNSIFGSVTQYLFVTLDHHFVSNLLFQSLLTIFRARHNSGDQSREKNSAIESCDVAIDDGLGRKSRLVARVSFRNGTHGNLSVFVGCSAYNS